MSSSPSKSWSVAKLFGKLEEHSLNLWWYKWGNWIQRCEAGQLMSEDVRRGDLVPEAREPFLLGWDLWTRQSEFHLEENRRALEFQASWGLFQGPWHAKVRLRFELKAFDIELSAHTAFKRLLGKLLYELHRHFPRHTEYPILHCILKIQVNSMKLKCYCWLYFLIHGNSNFFSFLASDRRCIYSRHGTLHNRGTELFSSGCPVHSWSRPIQNPHHLWHPHRVSCFFFASISRLKYPVFI